MFTRNVSLITDDRQFTAVPFRLTEPVFDAGELTACPSGAMGRRLIGNSVQR